MLQQALKNPFVQAAVVLTAIAAVGIIIFSLSDSTLVKDYIENPKFIQWFVERGPIGILLFFVLFSCATAVGFPRQLVAFIAGFGFGFLPGLILACLSATMGCTLTYLISRKLARPWVTKRYPGPIKQFDDFVKKDSFIKIVIIRFMPFGTNLTTNLAAGVSDISLKLFLIASAFGFLPQMIIFSLTGNGLKTDSNLQLIVSGLLFVVSMLLSWHLYQKYKTEKKTEDQTTPLHE